MDWAKIAKLAQEGFRNGVNQWIGIAMVQGGKVNGTMVHIPSGSLSSGLKVEMLVLQALMQGQAPPEIAKPMAHALSSAWEDWAKMFTLTMPGAFPMFAAFPGPMAPPTPMVPVPLAVAASAGDAMMKAPILAAKLTTALKRGEAKATGSLDAAVKSLAAWLEGSYTDWKNATVVTGLMGSGPVPTFAPPYVPVGPVVGGSAICVPGRLFTGPRFGRPSMP